VTDSIHIHLADDHAVFRAGLRALLAQEDGLVITGESSNTVDALAAVRATKPDILILDIDMPGRSAAEVVTELSATQPETRVLILTMHNEERYLREFLRLGARGFVVKTSTGSEVVGAIRKVHAGEEYVDPAMAHFLISSYVGRAEQPRGGVEVLTAREREICAYLANGHTNAEVAKQLQISRRTVETHRASIMAKVGLKSRAELVKFALDSGLWSKGTGRP
jgi:two-component system, NarL family, response regulator NreC